MENRIYLDHAATTRLDPRVLEAMLPILQEDFGNASSVHTLGRKARYLVEDARERVAKHLGAEASEVFFTSGGTEANNAAVLGSLCHTVISNPAEHESVLQAVTKFSETGRVGNLRVGPNGLVDLDQLERECAKLDPGFLVSVMRVNNETGTRNDIRRAGDIVHAAGGYLHCDAVQAAAHERIDVDTLGVDLMTLSGHKLNGPKGVGVLYVRAGTPFRGVVVGGSQERGRRAGTENVAAIVGMAKAMDLAKAEMEDNVQHIRGLQSVLLDRIRELLGSRVVFNTPNED
ncbi:MAG: cysteine desulfurase, partial [Rhodothermia bacterium]|nr:cysteine desulfurase [Rhodothermia bacterium]